MPDPRQDFLDAQERMLDRYGVDARSVYVDAASIGGRAHALEAGDGFPVVLLNGIGTPGAMWAPLMATLGGFRLLAVDLPGFGLTDAPTAPATDPRRIAVPFLSEVLDGLGLGQPGFVANSLGSLWAIRLALDRPDRVGASVHVGCPAVALQTSAPLPMRLLSVGWLGRLLTRLDPPSRRQVERIGHMVGQAPLPEELVDLLVATERLPGFRRTFLGTLHALLRLRGSRPEHRITPDQLRQVTQPTLLVWGADDPFGAPEVGRQMATLLPAAECVVVPGGHAPWLSAPERVGRAAADVLRQRPGRAAP